MGAQAAVLWLMNEKRQGTKHINKGNIAESHQWRNNGRPAPTKRLPSKNQKAKDEILRQNEKSPFDIVTCRKIAFMNLGSGGFLANVCGVRLRVTPLHGKESIHDRIKQSHKQSEPAPWNHAKHFEKYYCCRWWRRCWRWWRICVRLCVIFWRRSSNEYGTMSYRCFGDIGQQINRHQCGRSACHPSHEPPRKCSQGTGAEDLNVICFGNVSL